jgi:hypothetical protein
MLEIYSLPTYGFQIVKEMADYNVQSMFEKRNFEYVSKHRECFEQFDCIRYMHFSYIFVKPYCTISQKYNYKSIQSMDQIQ